MKSDSESLREREIASERERNNKSENMVYPEIKDNPS